MSKLKNKENEESSVLKAGAYYIVCQFLVKGIGFITTPIFARLLSKVDYGNVSNFFSWSSLLIPLVTLDLRVTINKSRYDYEEDNDSYLATILIGSNIVTLLSLAIIEFNRDFFENIFSMDIVYIRIMFLYILFQTAFDYQQIQFNIFHKYRKYVFYTIVSTIASLVLSVVLVLIFTDKFAGRIWGCVIPAVVVDAIIYINILMRSKEINIKYAKYAILMAVPLIPSALSASIMSTSDRAMITKMCGSEETALYSVAYSVSSIAGILWTALNQAWSPWLYDKFASKQYDNVRNYSKKFALLYASLIIGIMLVSPEIVYLMGGSAYYSTIAVMPPVILAMVCQFFYAFYYNVEYFYGETYIISLGTMIAAAINLLLNYIFIPKFGYVSAAYTTLVGYAIMYLYHYLIVRFKLKKTYIYNNNFFVLIVIGLIIIQIGISMIYSKMYLRYLIIGIYIAFCALLCVKNRNVIMQIVRKFKQKD